MHLSSLVLSKLLSLASAGNGRHMWKAENQQTLLGVLLQVLAVAGWVKLFYVVLCYPNSAPTQY